MKLGGFLLSDGRKCLINEVRIDEARELIKYVNYVAGESDNLTFGSDEFNISVEDEKKYIEQQHKSNNSLYLAARVDGEIVGSINLTGSAKKRLCHSAEFGVSVLKDYWGLGIGTALIEEMINYSQGVGISKINLKVRADNVRAISLYKKFGFVKEGLEKRGMLIDGEYVDFILMGLILNNKMEVDYNGEQIKQNL